MKLNVSTNREAFEKVALHLAGMDKQSMNDGVCAYRGPKGAKCAIGALITRFTGPDEGIVQALIRSRRLTVPEQVTPILLTELQAIHDNEPNWDPNGFRGWQRLAEIGGHYRIKGAAKVIAAAKRAQRERLRAVAK